VSTSRKRKYGCYQPTMDDAPIYYDPWSPHVHCSRLMGFRDYRNAEQKMAEQRAGQEEADQIAAEVFKAKQERLRTDRWEKLFHTREETENVKPLTYAIDRFLPEKGITMIGGRSGDGKTLIALNMARCLLDGTPLFGHFPIVAPSKRVVYLVPESGLEPFVHRLKLFHLVPEVGSRLFYRTLDAQDPDADLTDKAILKACEGADVFLDTAVRFMDGDENSSSDNRQFARNLFALLRAGARTVTGLHHAPKQFERATYMRLENVLRGSGDIGAMLAMAWGVAQTNLATTEIFVENIKDRDPRPEGVLQPFTIEGRPHLNETGYFKMLKGPGMAGSYNENKAPDSGGRGGRPKMANAADKLAQAKQLKADGKSIREIAEALQIGKSTVSDWLAGEAARPVAVRTESVRVSGGQ
jgi:hypothetical protein